MSFISRVFHTLYSPKYLLYTNTLTGALFLGSGDIIEQQLVEKHILNHSIEYDSKRTGISSFILTFNNFDMYLKKVFN